MPRHGSEVDVGRTPPHVLSQYALLGDGERGILVGPRGDFVWLCFPRWDDEPVFGALLGGGGDYSVRPTDRYVWGGYYEHGTLIWRSRWVTEDNSIVECREALALPTRADRAVVLRRVVACAGTVRVSVALNPRAGFSDAPIRGLSRGDDGRWTFRTGEIHACWTGGDRAQSAEGEALALELTLDEGEEHDFVLVLARDAKDLDTPEPDALWSETEEVWRGWMPDFSNTVGERDARHAYAVLAGLTSAGGGMVAAATTSLPERARQGRNYDYRYVWIRDQCYAGEAIAKVGAYPLLDCAVKFVRERLLEHGPDLKPAYTTTGGPVPDEQEIELPGYPGGTAKIGNHVNEQFQLDAFGEALLLFATAHGHDRLDADGWRAAEIAAEAIEKRWTEPDAGIWELDPEVWTHSRLTCAAGLRAMSATRPGGEETARWLSLADAITADTSAHALHPSGRWQRTPTDDRLDAALLLPAIRGAIPADDPRSVATVHAYAEQLTVDGYAYRYKADHRPLGEAEGAFLLCGFLLSLAWSQQGETLAAARAYERNRAGCGPPGLLAEEFDVTQRQLRGNLPQAFVHALLIECAAEQYRAETS